MKKLNKRTGFSMAMGALVALMFIMLGVAANNSNAEDMMKKNGMMGDDTMMSGDTMMKDSGPKAIRKYALKDAGKVAREGERLWADTSLGTSGLSCSSCHPGGEKLHPEPYPKYISMAGDVFTLSQMINFCMINPMKAEPLAYNSQKLTALASYVTAHTQTSMDDMGKMKGSGGMR